MVGTVHGFIPAHLQRLRHSTEVRLNRPRRGMMSVDNQLQLATLYDNACRYLEAEFFQRLGGADPSCLDYRAQGLIRDHIQSIRHFIEVWLKSPNSGPLSVAGQQELRTLYDKACRQLELELKKLERKVEDDNLWKWKNDKRLEHDDDDDEAGPSGSGVNNCIKQEEEAGCSGSDVSM